MRKLKLIPRHRRGAAAVLAMLFLVLFTTLSVAMYSMASLNVQAADNLADNDKARAAAESGLRWMSWRFTKMNRPKTTIGNISADVADSLWPSIRTSITNDFALMLNPSERTLTWNGTTLTSTSLATDNGQGRFIISVRQHPIDASDTMDERYLRVTSTGSFGGSVKSVSMDFKIDKKVKYAIVGRVPIQIGRNTIVEGPVAMTTPNKYPPILMLSDFRHLTSSLKTKIDNFNTWLKANHKGYDNRVNVHNPDEFDDAAQAGYTDHNGDSFIDEYDIFLKEFDANGDKAISQSEFTNPSTGQLYDPDLFKAMDDLGGPLFAGDPIRTGYQDGKIDNNDAYTKLRGQLSMATTANAWAANLASSGKVINDMIQGPITSDDGAIDPAVKFGVDGSEVFDLAPSNFDTTSFKNKTGPTNGPASATPTVITNTVLTSAMANAGTANEKTPFGSTSHQATYKRPVFQNIKFVNCRIPKGLNARFDNCTFEGVTFVELTTNITNSSGQTTTSASEAMTWSKKMKSGSFTADTVLTVSNSHGFEKGNNLRFNNCTMKGPLASDNPTAYSHFTNSWEFTGSTMFDNQFDETATIVGPQTNIELGSFTAPGAAPSTLKGVVVAGNIDIRGKSIVDGSIIVTGDGAGNTTQGWFGPSDSATDVNFEMPEGGYGRLNIRYNPTRALPDGINIAVDILPDNNTYSEGN